MFWTSLQVRKLARLITQPLLPLPPLSLYPLYTANIWNKTNGPHRQRKMYQIQISSCYFPKSGLCKLVGISLWHGFLCQNKMNLWMDCGNFSDFVLGSLISRLYLRRNFIMTEETSVKVAEFPPLSICVNLWECSPGWGVETVDPAWLAITCFP